MSNTVLAVDKNPDILRLVEANLGRGGCRVLTASDAPTALSLLDAEPVELVVINSEMAELLAAVKAHPRRHDFRIMLIGAGAAGPEI